MKNRAGFSMIELMTTVVIFSVILLIATPNMISWVSTQRFNSAVRDIQANIEVMRMLAVKENSTARISFTEGSDTYYTIQWKRGVGGSPRTLDHKLPPGITVNTITLEFNSLGMANIGGTGTVTVHGHGNLSLNIVVSITGSSRII